MKWWDRCHDLCFLNVELKANFCTLLFYFHQEALLLVILFIYFGFRPQSRITESFNSPIFNVLRNLHTLFCSVCTNLRFCQQCTVAFSPFSCQHLLSLFNTTILTDIERYLIVHLICISLVSDIDYLLKYLLAIWISLEKYLLNFCPFFILFLFLFYCFFLNFYFI